MPIDESKLITYLIGAFIMFVLGLIVNQTINHRKERRDVGRWQFGNVKDFFFEKYLTDEIRSNRKSITDNQHLDNPESKDKYELTISIQQMGMSAYLGMIPLEPILAGNAPQVVSDWTMVFDHVIHVRKRQFNIEEIPFQRRHGEWLALICYQWVVCQKFILNKETQEQIASFTDTYGGMAQVSKREKLLFSIESELVKTSTDKIVSRIRRKYFWFRVKSWLTSLCS